MPIILFIYIAALLHTVLIASPTHTSTTEHLQAVTDLLSVPQRSMSTSLHPFAAIALLSRNDLPSAVSRSGFNFDPCDPSTTCQGTRRCFDTSSASLCSTSSKNCTCYSSDAEAICTSSSTCDVGESCAKLSSGRLLCTSCSYIALISSAQTVDDGTCGTGNGLNGDSCSTTIDCKGIRACFDQTGLCSSSSSRCFCLNTSSTPCTLSSACDEGERCVQASARNICLSCASVPSTATPVDGGNCGSGTSDPSASPSLGLPSDPSTSPSSTPLPEMSPSESPAISSSPLPQPSSSTSSDPGLDSSSDTSSETSPTPSTSPSPTVTATETETENPTSAPVGSTGLNGDSCTSSTDCKGSRDCIASLCTNTDPTCSSSDKCDTGERCVKTGGLSVCLSCGVVPNPPPASVELIDDGKCNVPSAVCVAAEALQHLPKSDLVFTEHVQADVLCDVSGSCATHGHVVVYEGRAMMMETYCKLHAECRAGSMLVNSPKLKRGLRVASKTKGLEFTAYAARYRTKAEEVVLRGLVRFGM